MKPHEVNSPGITLRPKVTYVVTASMSKGIFEGQVAYKVENGCYVDFASSLGPELNAMHGGR
jgi:hypothetical protein